MNQVLGPSLGREREAISCSLNNLGIPPQLTYSCAIETVGDIGHFLMLSAAEYREQAQKCLDLAENVRPTEKRMLLEIAHTWLKLVRQAEISELATIAEEPK